VNVGIFGHGGVGKSTLFRALAGGEGVPQGKQAGVCAIKVPDDRVDRVAGVFRPKKVTHVSISFHDIDAGEPELLSTQALASLRNMDVLAVVLRGFSDDFHPAPHGGLSPPAELREITSAVVLSDYLVAQKRIERMTKEEERAISGFRFISRIPMLLVLNVGEEGLRGEAFPELSKAAEEAKAPLVRLCAKVEEEISRLSPAEQAEFLREMGIARGARDRLVRGAFDAMEYICFITVGEEEVRAWTVRRGTTALAAAGRVHSDLEKGFIRAEVIPCEEFLRCGSMAKARSEGKLRLEGKEYIVKDGEIFHVRFNV
jgi:ribosome-binding ATPase